MALDRKWRTVKLHDRDPFWASLLREGCAKAVYSYRDLRDVAFSLISKQGLTFHELLDSRLLQRIIKNDKFWREQCGVLVQRYEDLIADYPVAVQEIGQHLSLQLEDSLVERVASEYSIEANIRRIAAFRRTIAPTVNLEDRKNWGLKDAVTELHWNHISSTALDRSWRQMGTPTEIATLNEVCGEWLAANGYPAS